MVNLLKSSSSVNSGQALFTLRCCGSVLVDCPGPQRQKFADEIWNHMQADTSFKMDISHYNTLLRVYLDNGKDFSPQDILTELATNELTPNRVTYQHLITKFCQVSYKTFFSKKKRLYFQSILKSFNSKVMHFFYVLL